MSVTGAQNAITDVPGVRIGHAQDDRLKSGVSVMVMDAPFTCGCHIMGGAPGTRETALLAPDRLVQQVDALVLAGGSAFGLDAASGVADGLRAMGRGFAVGDQRVPIVPGAILFDLLNGGDKDWGPNPYGALGRAALEAAANRCDLGTVGAGTGATTATCKGGLGTASALLPGGVIVGAMVAVNALGSATVGEGRHFWAAPFEEGAEFGGHGLPAEFPDGPPPVKGVGTATTIGIVATNAALTQAECTRLATASHDGLARALVPAHTPYDGDLIFAASCGEVSGADPVILGHVAATVMARAIARGVYHASAAVGDPLPCYADADNSR